MGGERTTAESRLRELISTTELGDVVTLLLARWNHNEVPSYMLAELHRDLAKDFKDSVTDFTQKKKLAADRNELTLRLYDPQYNPESHEVMWMEAPEVEERLQTLLHGIPEAGDANPLDTTADFSLFNFYVLTVKTADGTKIRCFRTLTASKVFKKGILASLIDDRFHKVDRTSLVFEPGFHVILYQGFLFIFSKFGFETLFKYYEEAKQQAGDILAKINLKIPIANAEKLQERLTVNVMMARRLLIIFKSAALKDIKISKLKKTIADFDLPVNIIKKNGKEMLEYDDTRPYELLKLLEDQIVDSHTTGRSYEANSKREIAKVRKRE